MSETESGWAALMDTIAKRLAWAINMRKLESAAQAGRLIGIPESTMRTYLLGTRLPPLEKCEEIAAALRINARWLHSGVGTPEIKAETQTSQLVSNIIKSEKAGLTVKARTIPLYASALAGPLGEFMLNTESAGTVPCPPDLETVDDAYAVYVVGESMDPRYIAGEVVFVHPWKPVRRGDYVVVQIFAEDGAGSVLGMVKRLVSISEDEIVLSQLNPQQEIKLSRSRVKSVHRVVGTYEG